jgi:NAD dependent epimerase/dehydratase family enzyme
MGQMGEELLLAGKQIRPKKALDSGYIFKYKTLEEMHTTKQQSQLHQKPPQALYQNNSDN